MFSNGINKSTSYYCPSVDHQASAPSSSCAPTTEESEIPKDTLSRAVLKKQSDGRLQWITTNRFGVKECHFFDNEECLDSHLCDENEEYLSNDLYDENALITIWKIEDQIQGKTIYKYYDRDEIITCSTEEELHREIASTTEHGVFHIHDLNTNKHLYLQPKQGWLHRSFDKVTLDEACNTVFSKEKKNSFWRKITACGIAALTCGPALMGFTELLSRGYEALKPAVSLSSYSFANSLKKTTSVAALALTTYGISQGPGKSLSRTLFGILSLGSFAKAQFCPQLMGQFPTPDTAWKVAASETEEAAYVAADSAGVCSFDIRNVTDPLFAGCYDTPGRALNVKRKGNHTFTADWDQGLDIAQVSNRTQLTHEGRYNSPGLAHGIYVPHEEGNDSLVADSGGAGGGLQVVDSTNKKLPERSGWYDTPFVAWGVAGNSTIAGVADQTSVLFIDWSIKTNPVEVSSITTLGSPYAITKIGDSDFWPVAAYAGGWGIIEDSRTPRIVFWHNTTGFCLDITVNDTDLYVAEGPAGASHWDVTIPASPVFRGRFDCNATGVTPYLSYLLVADSNYPGLKVVDPFAPCPTTTTSSTTITTTTATTTTAAVTAAATAITAAATTTSLPSSLKSSASIVRPSSSAPQQTGKESEPKPDTKERKVTWIIIGFLLAVCAGMGTAVYSLFRRRSSSEDNKDVELDRTENGDEPDESSPPSEPPGGPYHNLPHVEKPQDGEGQYQNLSPVGKPQDGEGPYHNLPPVEEPQDGKDQYQNLDEIQP
ncbi:MAG: hypothetical protein K940chlam7_01898 [Chlamydiae bacterium]|nr:hypothetical protein [Chlamydiota bacterium]